VRIKDPEKATRLLVRRVETLLKGHKHVGFRLPSSIDMAVQLWVDAGDLPKAMALLMKMQELYEAGKIPEGPDPRSFHPLLQKWRKSDRLDKQSHIEYLQAKISEAYENKK